MQKSGRHRGNALVDEAAEALRTGQLSPLLPRKRRDAIRRAIAARRVRGAALITLRLAGAAVFTRMLDMDVATECLGPLFVDDGTTLADGPDLRRLHGPVLAQALLHAAAVLYRRARFGAGAALAKRAVDLLGGTSPAETRDLDLLEAHLMHSRLIWHVPGESAERAECTRRAEQVVADSLRSLWDILQSDPRSMPRAAILAAFGCDLYASLLWARGGGGISDAVRRAYQSLILLRAHGGDDVRIGHASYVLALAEYSSGSRDWPLILLGQAEEHWRRCEHPFAGRAAVVRAQMLTKADQVDDARRLLEEWRHCLGPDAVLPGGVMSNADERAFAASLWGVTDVWLRERAASSTHDWQACARAAAQYEKTAHPHLRAEFRLHRGIAAIRLGQLDKAQGFLEPLVDGREGNKERTRIAARLARVELLLRQQEYGEANEEWKRADAELANTSSAYLSALRDRLAPAVKEKWLIGVSSGETLRTLRDNAERQYVRYIEERISLHAMTREQVPTVTGLERAQWERLRRKHGILGPRARRKVLARQSHRQVTAYRQEDESTAEA